MKKLKTRVVVLEVGQYYMVGYANSGKPYVKTKLIKPTLKSVNFLDEEANECILTRHLYPLRNTKNKYLIFGQLHIIKMEET